eukprot:CAMPEP_0179202178 /NCGR_PEP_ID=MMETSP0796-20121207/100678_1 /TAXON_ID=73915 /ORGANISM="Pyrodinium bahamense, Strain pbaha01" /LENGTH=62 /DNA_ID=CAMNT_0020906845 /DNA_START=181 /DNA_END=366 /DNA_ORIENTATION=-
MPANSPRWATAAQTPPPAATAEARTSSPSTCNQSAVSAALPRLRLQRNTTAAAGALGCRFRR